jgi:hypothetical protein
MDILEAPWICVHKFENVEHFSKIITLCRFAGIVVDGYLETTHDLVEYPYIGVYYEDANLDRWGTIEWKDSMLARRITAKELEVMLIERINQEVKK